MKNMDSMPFLQTRNASKIMLAECKEPIKSAEGFLCEIGAHEILPRPAARKAARLLPAFATAGYSGKSADKERGGSAAGRAFGAGVPAAVSIGDTAFAKPGPRKGAKRPALDAGWLYSHLDGKKRTAARRLPPRLHSEPARGLAIELCSMGKIEMACSLAAGLPCPKARGYALFDSWHSCQAVVGAFWSSVWHSIGALKTNRAVVRCGARVSIKVLAEKAGIEETCLAAAGSSRCRAFSFKAPLKGIPAATVLLSWPEAISFGDSLRKAMAGMEIGRARAAHMFRQEGASFASLEQAICKRLHSAKGF
jgi:hypothetical protein